MTNITIKFTLNKFKKYKTKYVFGSCQNIEHSDDLLNKFVALSALNCIIRVFVELKLNMKVSVPFSLKILKY